MLYYDALYVINLRGDMRPDIYDVNLFYGKDMRSVDYESVKAGELLSLPDLNRDKNRDEIIGWYTAEFGGKKWDFARDKMPAHTLNLYARYRMKKYTVTFDNDGDLFNVEGTLYRRIQQPTKPQKHGFIFKGWSKSQDKEELWDFSSDEVLEDMTLYAVFEPLRTVTYDVDVC